MNIHYKNYIRMMRFAFKALTGALIFSLILMIFQTAVDASGQPENQTKEKMVKSPQYRDGQFKSGKEITEMSFMTAVSTTWEFLFGGTDRKPGAVMPVSHVDQTHFRNRQQQHLSATWLGHSSLMINIGGYRILTDPVFEKHVSILGPTRFNGDVPLGVDQLSDIDIVLISHDHWDHLNKFSITGLKDKVKKFVVPLAVGAILQSWGVARKKIVELDWWEEYRFDDHLLLAATPAQHFSGRGLTNRNQTLWASWVIAAPGHKIFFSGDSGYFDGFKQIGEAYGPFDMTFIECGAYNEMWEAVHLFPEQTVRAHLDLKGEVLHPIHWGTFNLSLHPWYEPMQRLVKAARAVGIKTATPVVGDTTRFSSYIPDSHWWESVLQEENAAEGRAYLHREIER